MCANSRTDSRRDILRIGLAASAVLLPGTSRADEAHAEEIVRAMVEDLDRRFAVAGSAQKARIKAARAVLGKWFDVDALGAMALGDSWNVLSIGNRKRYRNALVSSLAHGMAERYQDFSGAEWTVAGSRSLPSGTIAVFTRTRTTGGRDRDAEWVVDTMRRKPILDVTADGFALSLRMRRDFTRIMDEAGFDVLIERLEDRHPDNSGSVLP